jgi:hypothetical protein
MGDISYTLEGEILRFMNETVIILLQECTPLWVMLIQKILTSIIISLHDTFDIEPSNTLLESRTHCSICSLLNIGNCIKNKCDI